VLVGAERLGEARALLRELAFPPPHELRLEEDAIDAAGADGHDAVVEHHEGQAAVAFQPMGPGVDHDGRTFPVLEPEVARHERVVLVGQAVAPPPVVELAARQAQPTRQAAHPQLRSL